MLKEQPKFEEVITALATYVYARSEYKNGQLVHYYFGYNGLDVAPDILARSKLMDFGDSHLDIPWIVDWCPGHPLPIVRNDEEATVAELKIALVNVVRWHYRSGWSARSPSPPLILFETTIKRAPFDRNPERDHFYFAMYLIAVCLAEFDLGMFDDKTFILNERGNCVPEDWHYWTNENRKRRANALVENGF